MIRVAIVDDHPLYRQGLATAVEAAGDLELVSSSKSIEEFDANRPEANVVLLDLHLPGLSGAAGVAHVSGLGFAVLVVSAAGTPDDVLDAIGAGAGGYLTKDADGDEITRAVRLVAEGGSYVSPTLASYLLRASRAGTERDRLALTEREREVLALVAAGETDQDIAEQLYISIRTVRSHLDRIRDKTGARRRADLTRLAIDQGIVPKQRGT